MSVAFARGIGNGPAIMRCALSLVLILCLALTGIGLGAARGTVMMAGQVVICTGQGPVVMDRPDAPGRPHLCPDMALSLLAAVAPAPPGFSPSLGASRHLPHPHPRQAQGRGSPVAVARGPPAGPRPALKPV